MALSRWSDADNDLFANPIRALLDPRFLGPSLLTASGPAQTDASPIRVDVLEKEDKFIVKADVPGVLKENVNLSLDGDLLTLAVEGGKNEEKDEEVEGIKVHRVERVKSWARRVIRLPDSADTDGISASVDHGVLQVNVPKKQAAAQRKRQISIGGGADQNPAPKK